MKIKSILLLVMLCGAMNVTASDKFIKHYRYGCTQGHFTWDCYGEVNSLDDAMQIIGSKMDFKDSVPDMTFRLYDTVVDKDRKHYIYRAYNNQGMPLQYSVFTIHTITRNGQEKPYFAAGGYEKSDTTIMDHHTTPTLSFKPIEGIMKQCEVETMYNGKQTIDYLEAADGTGYLYDTKRNIYTLDDSFYALKQKQNLPKEVKDSLSMEGVGDTNTDRCATAHVNHSLPVKTNGDLFKTGYGPLALSIDSVKIDYKYLLYPDSDDDDDFVPTGYQKHSLETYFKNVVTGERVEFYKDSVTTDEDDDFAMYKTIKFNNDFIMRNLNWRIVFIWDKDTTNFIPAFYNMGTYVINGRYVEQKQDCHSDKNFVISISMHPVEIQPILDVHFGMQKVYDAYYNLFGYDSYDNRHSPIFMLGNIYNLCGKGQADGLSINEINDKCVIGMGFGRWGIPGETDLPHVSMSTIGHEFTHKFQDALPQEQLDYSRESGALNESFADIIGVSLESIALHGPDVNPSWNFADHSCLLKGTDCSMMSTILDAVAVATNFRSLKNPELSGRGAQPSVYKGENYKYEEYSGSTDNGWVHTNSGVQNHWYYLMAEGGEKTIPFRKALNLVFQTLKYYTFPVTDYQDVYHLYKACAKYQELDGIGFGNEADNSILTAVIDNWHKSGVCLEQDVDPTAISAVETVSDINNSRAYDLRGCLVNPHTFKGIYIQNGKKFNFRKCSSCRF